MANPTKVVIDCSTGIEEVIELTDAEVAELEAAAAQAEADRAAAEQAAADKAAAREAVAAKVGLTPEDLALLLGL